MGGGGGDGGAALQQQEEAQKEALRQRVNALYMGTDVAPQLAAEEDQLSKTLRDYYSADLKKQYDTGERGIRFGAANTGNLGGSAYADATSQLNEQNAMGGTRIEEAVQRAVNNLRNAREDSRTRSISLINSGEGESGVQAAQQGLHSAISSANSANKENLFSDLFSNLALAKVGSDTNSQNAALMALYNKNRSGSYFPQSPTSGGTVIRGY